MDLREVTAVAAAHPGAWTLRTSLLEAALAFDTAFDTGPARPHGIEIRMHRRER